jgi:prepilin signal peptidase PulO-like enzyme (type II secretory pathway)
MILIFPFLFPLHFYIDWVTLLLIVIFSVMCSLDTNDRVHIIFSLVDRCQSCQIEEQTI